MSTTIDALKPIFAKIARILESGHSGDEEGRRKKQREEEEPSAAKPKSKSLRYEATFAALGYEEHQTRSENTPLSAIPPIEMTVNA